VSSAVYGSQAYCRFSPSTLAPVLAGPPAQAPVAGASASSGPTPTQAATPRSSLAACVHGKAWALRKTLAARVGEGEPCS
jgi:hypothetical protein